VLANTKRPFAGGTPRTATNPSWFSADTTPTSNLDGPPPPPAVDTTVKFRRIFSAVYNSRGEAVRRRT